jgi:hypothetical protein
MQDSASIGILREKWLMDVSSLVASEMMKIEFLQYGGPFATWEEPWKRRTGWFCGLWYRIRRL